MTHTDSPEFDLDAKTVELQELLDKLNGDEATEDLRKQFISTALEIAEATDDTESMRYALTYAAQNHMISLHDPFLAFSPKAFADSGVEVLLNTAMQAARNLVSALKETHPQAFESAPGLEMLIQANFAKLGMMMATIAWYAASGGTDCICAAEHANYNQSSLMKVQAAMQDGADSDAISTLIDSLVSEVNPEIEMSPEVLRKLLQEAFKEASEDEEDTSTS